MITRKESDQLHRDLKTLILETGREGIKDYIENDIWIMGVKSGEFVIYLLHPIKEKYVEIRFSFELDANFKKMLKDSYADLADANKFSYGLRASIANPYNGYALRLEDSSNGVKIPIGFDVVCKIFPLDKLFTIHYLENSIQSVVNSGAFGMSYFGSILQVNETLIKQQEAMRSSPGAMFG